ncbi:MAG: hypothetical protein JW791_03550 [Nanoarchaeota archaeon]|nr:hypothetical protein [Nanoarchaeota archaeon]
MAKKKDTKKIRIKKKKWFDIALPAVLKGEVFTEGFAESAEKLIGRSIIVSLGDVLKSGSKRHLTAKLIVDNVKTSTAHTRVKNIDVSAPYLQRKTRKNSKVSAKVVGKTSDGVLIDLRMAAIANGHALSTAKKDIRKILVDYMNDVVSKTKKDGIIIDVISGKIQNSIKKDLHKVHPIRSVELEKLVIKQ